MWFDVFKAVVLFVVLTANVWGAFLLLYPTNQMASPIDFSPVLTSVNLSLAGTSTMWTSITEVTLLLFIVQIIYVAFNFKSSRINTFVTLEGLVFFYLSSNLFPWQFVKRQFSSCNWIFTISKSIYCCSLSFIVCWGRFNNYRTN